MSTEEDRIKALKARAAARREKLKNLPAVVKLAAAADADEALAAKLEVEHRKKEADKARRDDAHAKIVLGAGLLLLPGHLTGLVLPEISAVLTPRDRDWITGWCQARDLEFKKSLPDDEPIDQRFAALSSSAQPSGAASDRDPIGDALKNVIGALAEGEFGLLAPEILNHATVNDRAVLETWFASRNSAH